MYTRRGQVSLLLVAVIAGLFALAVSGWTQDKSTGAIRGRVMDINGDGLAGVVVRLTSDLNSQGRTTTTTDTGAYRFMRLPPGKYSLEGTKDGFETGRVEDIKLLVHQFAQVPIYLRTKGT
jgi:Carboxypeptidase regulatory-like domain